MQKLLEKQRKYLESARRWYIFDKNQTMADLFWYQREIKERVKSEPSEDGTTPPDKEVIEKVWDCFNVSKVIRAHWTSKNEFTVLLDDGHEQAEDMQKPVWKNGKVTGVEIKRERAWYVSQIPLGKEDAERFRAQTDWNYLGGEKEKVVSD